MHAFAGDSSVGAVPTETGNEGTVLGNPNAREFCLICYISHSPTQLQNIAVFWSKFEHCGLEVVYNLYFSTFEITVTRLPLFHNANHSY